MQSSIYKLNNNLKIDSTSNNLYLPKQKETEFMSPQNQKKNLFDLEKLELQLLSYNYKNAKLYSKQDDPEFYQENMIENYNRIDVHNLEKWLDHSKTRKSFTINYNNINDTDKIKKIDVSAMVSKKNNITYRNPELRPNILNSIIKDENEDENFIQYNEIHSKKEIDESTIEIKPKILRSLESIKAGINQDLLNEIFYRKIMKNNENKNNIKHFLREEKYEKNPVSNETINNFKSLRNLAKNQVFIVDCERIYKRIQQSSINYDEKLFDYQEELKTIENNKKRQVGYEEEFLEKFEEINQEIQQKLNIEKQIRLMNYTNNQKIITLKDNLDTVIKRYKALQDKLSSQTEKLFQKGGSSSPLFKNKPKMPIRNDSQLKLDKNIGDFMKMKKLQDEQEKTESDIRKTIIRLTEEIKLNKANLITLNRDIKELKTRKSHIQLQLKDLYFRFLKEEDEKYKNEPLTWIIKAFWRINLDFSADNLPKYLDKESIRYLYKTAFLENEFEEIKNVKKINFFLSKRYSMGNSIIQKTDLNASTKQMTEYSREKVKSTIKLMTNNLHSESLSKMNRNKKKLNIAIESIEPTISPLDFEQPRKSAYLEKKLPDIIKENAIDQKIKLISQEIELLKENEINRLKKNNGNPNIEKENKNFIKILKSLFGDKESLNIQELILNDKKEYNDNPDKILKIKKNYRSSTSLLENNEDIDKFKKIQISPQINRFFKKSIFSDNNNVNYKYNFIFNSAPKLQNLAPNSTFHKFTLNN